MIAKMERNGDLKVDSLQICSLSDGRAGNARQATALAEALAPGSFENVVLTPRIPWCWLAPRRSPGSSRAFGHAFAEQLAAPPALAIGCGRQAALASRLLRERGSRVVQILDPRLDPARWDLVVAPLHDGLRGGNVLTTLGSLHPVDDAWLARARDRFAEFAALPRPRTAVLLGGSSAHARFDRMAFEVLACRLEAALARDGGSLLVTASRRTSEELRSTLRHRYAETPGLTWIDEHDGPNPYAGLLAWADRIVCSPDSVNMISEACATTAPVFVFEPERVRGRPRHSVDARNARGRIRAVDARMAAFDVEPLRETGRIAAEVRARLGL
jgi:uncharacterized protein